MISIGEQVYIFLYAILAGAIAAFLYDLLRIKRRAVKTGVIFVGLEDILYWLTVAVFLFITVYNSNSGQMRGFIFIGNVIGVMLYESLLSNLIIKSSMMVIRLIIKIFKFIWMAVSYPFKLAYKIIAIPVAFIFRLIEKLFRFLGSCLGKAFKKADLKGKTRKLGGKVLTVKVRTTAKARKRLQKIAENRKRRQKVKKSKASQQN
ncbi:spore protein YabQ [Ruminiclostridium hungatei]|uniref:Spore protein YabQ n=1 Tax=Ruminiclostridium hungatei TaxID=48256 RepID=A0A1V4SIW0_RUMHU|nr:spore cortex biosynthesis protein YabQ [Ruminiclostridium hungatei]OPX43819.1 spore protein YabQ [Ruminiclostridium hungatei]